MNVLELSEQEINLRLNLQALKDLGIDPYPAAEFPTNACRFSLRLISCSDNSNTFMNVFF